MSETSNVIYVKFENHKVPEFKEVKNKDWVYFGDDNVYPDYLIELYLRCAKHNAIINGKCNYIYGGGLTINDETANISQKAVADKFIRVLDTFVPDMIKDFELFNSVAIEVIYNKSGRDVADFAYVPMSKIRTNKDESLYFYSNDWKATTRQDAEKTGFKEMKPFDINNPSKGSQLFVFKLKSPKNGVDKNVYGIPNYIGATSSIETDIEISNFHLNNIKSGFSMGTIINFNDGVPTIEAQEEIERQIKRKATGTDKAGGLVITFNKSQDNAPTITSFTPNELDKQFIEIGKRVDQEIFTAHNIISPTLFGVATAGALGQRNEMIDSYELFQSTYVNIRQSALERVINDFAGLFGIVNRIYFKKVTPVKSNIPDALIQQAYTRDEVREALGLKKEVAPPVNSQTFNETLAQLNSLVLKLSEQKKNLDVKWFKPLGVSQDKYKVLFERDFEGQSDEDCLNEFHKQTFASELTANQKAIIDLLTKDVLTPSDSIAKVLKISVSEVNDLIKGLVDSGHLTSGSEPTKKGEKASEGAKTEDVQIKYKYGWRAGFTDSDKKSSREFCKELLNENKLYSRSEIDNLNNEQDLDVWESRGGWWNKGGANLPYCRHLWKQVVVKAL